MKKVFAILLSAVLIASAFAGCGDSNRPYKDGTYTGKSAVISGDEEGNGNGYGNGSGYGYGNGSGYGDGNGSGYGDGNGDGSGDG